MTSRGFQERVENKTKGAHFVQTEEKQRSKAQQPPMSVPCIILNFVTY